MLTSAESTELKSDNGTRIDTFVEALSHTFVINKEGY